MQSKYPHQIFNLIRLYGLPSCQSLSAPDLIWWYRLPSNDASARQSIHRLDTSGSRFRTSKYLRISLIWWRSWVFRHFLRFRCAKPLPLLTQIQQVFLLLQGLLWQNCRPDDFSLGKARVGYILLTCLKALLYWLGCHTQHSNLSQLAKALVPEKVTLCFYLVVVVAKEVIRNRFYDGSLKRTT